MIKDVLQGKPIRHPLHPLLIHFPIGLFLLSLVLDVSAVASDPANALVRGAFYAMVGGIITALIAAIPGLVDWSDIRSDHPAKKIGLAHMILNLIVVGLYAANAGLRWGQLDLPQTPALPLMLSIVAIGLLMVSGYLGGEMIYSDGVSVGRHRRHTATPRQTIRVATTDSIDGLVEIAAANELPNHSTLRVDVDGNVMTIAKINGEFCAFQEFCSHRYGPLSEGTFKDGEVMCPWHRSQFDVRTGKVTKGPAKVDLKTYPVTVREGKICVRI